MRKILYTNIILAFALLAGSCNLLDIKPVNSMLPVSVEDYESVLLGGYPKTDFFMKTELMTDNVYANFNTDQSVTKADEPYFVWASSHQLDEAEDIHWVPLYKSIFYANSVLDEFEVRTPTGDERELFETVKGEAYALRAFSYFYLVNLYADNYTEENLAKPGVPMPLTAKDVNENAQNNVRTPIGRVWEQIVKDLESATGCLAGKPSKSKFRFDYNSVQLLKSRVYLFMGRYAEAVAAATTVIDAKTLTDLNSIQAVIDAAGSDELAFSGNLGFIDTDYENEVMFYMGGAKASQNMYYFKDYVFKPSQELLGLCSDQPTLDYRKYIFASFSKMTMPDDLKVGPTVYHMYGSYENPSYYIGMKLSEAYVIRAEAYTRMGGKKKEAVADLNDLLVTRFKDFALLTEVDFATDDALLSRVLKERRIETAFDAGLRWFDLRRLGKPAQTHIYKNGLEYSLKEGDLRYVLQIPQSEQDNSPEMPINPR